MFTRQNQVSLSPDFPPRERTEPVLIGQGVRNENVGLSKIEIAPREERDTGIDLRQERLVTVNQPGFPKPKLDIPLFDESNPRWWVRRCEQMFG